MSKIFESNSYGYPLIKTPYGERNIIYADHTASGKPFKVIEQYLEQKVYPYYANTHSNAYCGRLMSNLIERSKDMMREYLHLNKNDLIIFTGQGCSAAITHFVHLLNLNKLGDEKNEPVIFITDYEHNSNYLPWKHLAESIVNKLDTKGESSYLPRKHCSCSLEIIKTKSNGLIDLEYLENKLKEYQNRCFKLASFSAGSNISGIVQDTSAINKLVHRYGFFITYDFAAVGPYMKINMHQNDAELDYMDGIYFSPHKFLGGHSTPGVLIFNQKLCHNDCPFYPSGGTVRYISEKIKIYSSDMETRESGGTPNIIGCIKVGLVLQLKEKLLPYIIKKEHKIITIVDEYLKKIKNLIMVSPTPPENTPRVPIYSFAILGLHYNLVVVLLNDLFGIQCRGGVSCTGIYAKKILRIEETKEYNIVSTIISNHGTPKDYGWIRVTFHYTMPLFVIVYILKAIEFVTLHGKQFERLYEYLPRENLWIYKNVTKEMKPDFDLNLFNGVDHQLCLHQIYTPFNEKQAQKYLDFASALIGK